MLDDIDCYLCRLPVCKIKRKRSGLEAEPTIFIAIKATITVSLQNLVKQYKNGLKINLV